MAKKSLRAQLNQIRAWVRQGRTDAWIAHQLDVGTSELREFRRQHGLSADEEDSGEIDLRDEIEAEIEAAEDEEPEPEDEDEPEAADEGSEDEQGDDEEADGSEAEGRPKRRRRRGKRGGRRRRQKALEATFDHGEKEGYGLWLDAAVQDNPTYRENWAGKREMTVSIEADQIVIRRAGEPAGDDSSEDDS